MRAPRHFPEDSRGVSPVIGTILLVAIAVTSMAVVASGVLGSDLLNDSPSAEFVYDENAPGEVRIGVEEARGLYADDTEIRIEGGGTCGEWGGDGEITSGEVVSLSGTECSAPLTEGDVLQVISSGTLIDTYEIRGVTPLADFGCEPFEDELDDGDPITIQADEVVACDFVDDGNRYDVELNVYGTLYGDAKVNQVNVGDEDTSGVSGTIHGTVDSDTGLKMVDESSIAGDIELSGGTADLNDDVAIDGTLATENDVDVVLKSGGEIVIDGDIEGDRNVDVKDGHVVDGDVTADRLIDVGAGSTVRGTLDQTGADGEGVVLAEDITVEGAVTAANKQIVLGDDTVIEGAANIDDRSDIKCGADSEIDGVDCSVYKNE